jgi:hypothetical protein
MMRKTEKYRKTTRYPNFFSLKMSSSNQLFNEAGLATTENHIIDLKFKVKEFGTYVKELSEHIILNPNKKYKLNFIESNTSKIFYADIQINDKRIANFGNECNRIDADMKAIYAKFLREYKEEIPLDICKVAICLKLRHEHPRNFEFELKFAIEEIILSIPKIIISSPNKECCVCYENTYEFTNCYHYVCDKCIARIKTLCPMCRGKLN